MSVTLSAPLTWTDVARRLAAEANNPQRSRGLVRRARLGRYGIALEVPEGVSESQAADWLQQIFPGRVVNAPLALKLEGPEHAATLLIELQTGEEPGVFRPSFGLVDGTVEFDAPAAATSANRKLPIAATISIKGGTGRTTSAIALALRWAAISATPILLVDADFEAPGISYLFRQQVAEAKVSLEDVIILAHAEQASGAPATVEFVAMRLRDHLVGGNLFILPLRRDVDDLVGSAVRPEHLSTSANAFAFADLLADIACTLGCAGAVIDVRAGLVPLTVHLAMDPEVSLLIVSTLADQSLKATTALVRFLSQEARRSGSQPRRPLLVVNRVPNALRYTGVDQRLIEPLIDELVNSLIPGERDDLKADESIFDKDLSVDPFAQTTVPELPELQVSAAGWPAFLEQITGSGFTQAVGTALDQWIETELLSGIASAQPSASAVVDAEDGRKRLADYANGLIAAELPSRSIERPLITKPLAELAERFLSEVPIAVSEGAKGTGKTLAARFFIAQGTWDIVVTKLVGRSGAVAALMLPVCASIQSSPSLQTEADQARAQVAAALGLSKPLRIDETTRMLKQEISEGGTEQAWVGFWLDVIAWSAGFQPSVRGAGEHLAEYLRTAGKSLVAVLEGLEELYQSIDDPKVAMAMRTALVGLIQRLRAEPKRPLGLIVFARRDTIEASVVQNLDQFRREYLRFALTWTDDDILELAAWLASESQALPDLWDAGFAQLMMPQKTIRLERLWGKKLGADEKPGQRSREAYTATWVIAVLSDLRRRLVPRDLVRLLANAARSPERTVESTEYGNRLLVPRALRAAVEPTSESKVRETEEEILELRAVFEKFRKARNQVAVPLDQAALRTLDIGKWEIEALKRHGIVFGDNPPYEVPELFRRGLGLRHAGARHSVINLYRRARAA